jgi:hypothetical protein
MKYFSLKRNKFGLDSAERERRRQERREASERRLQEQERREASERRRAEEDEDGAIGASASGEQFYPLPFPNSQNGLRAFDDDWQESEAAARRARLELKKVFGREELQEEIREAEERRDREAAELLEAAQRRALAEAERREREAAERRERNVIDITNELPRAPPPLRPSRPHVIDLINELPRAPTHRPIITPEMAAYIRQQEPRMNNSQRLQLAYDRESQNRLRMLRRESERREAEREGRRILQGSAVARREDDDDEKCRIGPCLLMYGAKKRRSKKKHLRKFYRRHTKQRSKRRHTKRR